MNPLQDPAALHFACTHLTRADAFISDLKATVEAYKETGTKGKVSASAAMSIHFT